MKQTIYAHLVAMDAQERARLCGSACVGVLKMEQGTLKQAAKLDVLCPAALSERILGAPASCEAISRSAGTCRACTERFLRAPWPDTAPDGAFWD